jgi:hypothetical protein
LALAVEVGVQADLAEAVYEVFDERWGLSLEVLRDHELEALLAKLQTVDTIDRYHICAVLADACRRQPRAVVRLLLDRIARAAGGCGSYDPLPHAHEFKLDGLATTSEYADVLRDIRERSLTLPAEHWRGLVELPDLYKVASSCFDATGLAVLREWIDSSDPERIMGASHLLRAAPRTFVFDQKDYALHLLESAEVAGEECARRVAGDLFASAISGTLSGVPGQPFPEHITMLERSVAVVDRLSPGNAAQQFYEALAAHARERIRHSELEGEELLC